MPEQTWQPNASLGIDAAIYQNAKSTNYGNADRLYMGYNVDGDNFDILIKFDLSSIIPGSTIEVATFYMYCYTRTGAVPDVYLRRILEGNSGWTEGGATWYKQYGSTNWAGSNGCQTEGVDFAATWLYYDASQSAPVGGWNTFSLDPAEFQQLIDYGNYGWKFYSAQRSGSSDDWHYYCSSDWATASQRPKLYVRWIEPSGRPVDYWFDLRDPSQRVYNAIGEAVPLEEISPDKWVSTMGVLLPSSDVFSSKVQDPYLSYIEEVSYREPGQVEITSSTSEFADVIIARAAGRSAL